MAFFLGKTYINEAFLNAVAIKQIFDMWEEAVALIFEIEGIDGMLARHRNEKSVMV